MVQYSKVGSKQRWQKYGYGFLVKTRYRKIATNGSKPQGKNKDQTQMTASEFETLRADIRSLRSELTQQVAALRLEWWQEMITQVRWLAGLFVVQFIATVGAVSGIVAWIK
jgi:hypothetical protein